MKNKRKLNLKTTFLSFFQTLTRNINTLNKKAMTQAKINGRRSERSLDSDVTIHELEMK